MRAQVNDTELYVDVDGPQLRLAGDALVAVPTIVALHGGPGFDQGYLRPGIGPLRDVAQVVFVDLRGQGRSATVPVETCTLEQMADDVVALCGVLGLGAPVLLGHSAGGFVALHAALRAPAAFSALILCNTAATLAATPDPGGPTLVERAGAEAAAVARRVFAGDLSPDTAAAFARFVAPYYAGPAHEDVPARLFPLSPPSIDVMRRFFSEDAGRYDLCSWLGDIAVPTLVIGGRHDWVCPPSASEAIAAGIPGAELVVLDDAGHFSFSEEPAQFHDAVTTFLGPTISARQEPGLAS
jgi:pimeloyl-ACP methyl ester carboxylesterase